MQFAAAPRRVNTSLPPLRVNPALLGSGAAGSAAASAPGTRTSQPTQRVPAADTATASAPQTYLPPEVAEAPQLPPLYSAHAAAGNLPEPKLAGSRRLLPHVKQPEETLPAFLIADHIYGTTDQQLVAEGNVELRQRNALLESDRLTHFDATDEVEATGNVRLSNDSDRISGPRLRMKMADSTGFFEQPEYSIRRTKIGATPMLWTGTEEPTAGDLTTAQGKATRLDFEGEGKYKLTDATYSTCTPTDDNGPDWFARTSGLRLDYSDQTGTASDATVYFKGIPILYSPWLSFSLNNERKSGLLTPSFGTTTRSGFEYTQPFYWNIAPNMDATIAPRIMSKRGTLLGGEFRYLEPNYSGTLLGQVLPHDQIDNTRRSAYSIVHNQNFGNGFTGALNVSGASDGTYFSDFGRGSAIVAQTNLLRQGVLSYGASWWSASLLAQSYQTLQDPALPPVVIPYKRLPQINLNANRNDLPLGLSFTFNGENVNFRHPTLVDGRRFTLYPQLALPLETAAFYVTPKIGLHSTRYQLDGQPVGTPDKLTRNVPIFSVDSGVTFERPTEWFDTALTQTLEPRLFYVHIPVRDQSQIPVFDSALADFNFAQIFAENRYSGGDRIGDANQLTAMLTSRLIDPQSGAEIIRAGLGQRTYFSTQQVTLPGEIPRTNRRTDLLGVFSGRILPKTWLDTNIQYSTEFSRMERMNIGARYQPEIGKLLNAGYRYTRDQLGQIDVSGQWPVSGGWHAVGRFNYSTKESRPIETVAGLEYDGGCWVGRVVLQRLATQTQRSNTSLFFQLELNGFARLGSNPLELLKRSVPGYSLLNSSPTDSSLMVPTIP
ncbi:MAG: LPS-assembly protein LptD [Rhodocyclales bacterium]|nr:LPS-assembly protein LptD [Rhodocyclales bacterium]